MPSRAETKLAESTGDLTNEISAKIKSAEIKEINETANAKANDLPDEIHRMRKIFARLCLTKESNRNIQKLADFYKIAATVDVLVDISKKGEILNTEIVRWAGYGLDESVEKTVREMNWRAADRNGKSLVMRVLLRYNFKDIKTDE